MEGYELVCNSPQCGRIIRDERLILDNDGTFYHEPECFGIANASKALNKPGAVLKARYYNIVDRQSLIDAIESGHPSNGRNIRLSRLEQLEKS
ncbi:hypothetical protein J4447_01580 [Candidatus Pacearchaeota archaeon]|nr:hypothetical protein [Candidatus Pacearchaeota archaeon]